MRSWTLLEDYNEKAARKAKFELNRTLRKQDDHYEERLDRDQLSAKKRAKRAAKQQRKMNKAS